ncbi:hypothetical protein SUGI_0447290 [Cryptomeria japonica]|nr:hypothetical protein SUGI_0447290 [Cryptomeria japonica]
MALRKEPRSCQTPHGWRLATVEEANNNLKWMTDNNLLEKWDLARLLNGWIGGSAYAFDVQEAFRSCLGYMILIESSTPEISHADDRSAGLYSEVPPLSNEGRSAAVLLCSEDWNVEVLYWLMPGEDPPKWEDDETKAVSEIVSKVAREWQGVRAKSRVLSSLEDARINIQELLTALAVDTIKSLEALMNRIQLYEKGQISNEILEEFIPALPETGDEFLDEINLKEDLKTFKDLGFDTSVPSTWETLWYLTVDVVNRITFNALCKDLYSAVVMHSTSRPQYDPDDDEEMDDDWPTLASLIFCAYQRSNCGFDLNIRAAAEEANRDIKRFAETIRDQHFSIFSSEGKSDVFSTFLVRAVMKGNVNLVKKLLDRGVQHSETYYKEGTALHHAVGMEDESVGLKIAEMLLKRNAGLVDVKAKDTGETALNKAIEEGKTVNIVEF